MPVYTIIGTSEASLPIQAPVRTAYLTSPAALVFTLDAAVAVAGKFIIEATSAAVVKAVPVDVAASVPSLSLTFP